MFWQLMCECIERGPSIQQILDAIQRSTVCTATQCFDTPEDAGFGQLQQQNHTDFSFVVFMTMCVAFLIANRPASLLTQNKPNQIHQ